MGSRRDPAVHRYGPRPPSGDRHRGGLRAQGMRLIQVWVLDVHSPEFAAEARLQSLLVAQSPEEAEIQAFIDSVDEWPDAEPSQ